MLAAWPVGADDAAEWLELLTLHGWGRPERAPALDAAAEVLAERLAGSPIDAIPDGTDDALVFALHTRRISDARIYPLTIRHRRRVEVTRQLPALLARLDRRAPPTHFGAATHGVGAELTTTLLLVHRGVELSSPLPRTLAPGEKLRLRGMVRPGYFRPRVIVAPPANAPVRDRPAWTGARALDVTVHLDAGPGIYGVEIIADSQYGLVVLHNYPIYVGAEPPALPVTKLVAPTVAKAPDRVLFERIQKTRALHARSALVWDSKLAEAAGAHVAELASRGVLDHRSPNTGELTTRLRARGVRATRVAENLAVASTPAKALDAFLDSPGHKRNLLDARLTHAGVAALGDYYVVVFAQMR